MCETLSAYVFSQNASSHTADKKARKNTHSHFVHGNTVQRAHIVISNRHFNIYVHIIALYISCQT